MKINNMKWVGIHFLQNKDPSIATSRLWRRDEIVKLAKKKKLVKGSFPSRLVATGIYFRSDMLVFGTADLHPKAGKFDIQP
jgi:hypothetical protein